MIHPQFFYLHPFHQHYTTYTYNNKLLQSVNYLKSQKMGIRFLCDQFPLHPYEKETEGFEVNNCLFN